ncbi:MAG: hypothetical protein AAB656_01510 [Patescibacteria group bacterium]
MIVIGGDKSLTTEIFNNIESLTEQNMPFAMRFAEKAIITPVSGEYNEREQVWQGVNFNEFSMAPTATQTMTAGGRDFDGDSDWVELPG